MNWLKDKTKRISIIRTIIQLLFLFLIFYVSIVAVWKGLLLVIIIGATLLLGRFFCGWVCPLGLYQDTMTLLRRLLRIRHWSLPRKLNEDLHEARYLIALVILVVVLSAPFWRPIHGLILEILFALRPALYAICVSFGATTADCSALASAVWSARRCRRGLLDFSICRRNPAVPTRHRLRVASLLPVCGCGVGCIF